MEPTSNTTGKRRGRPPGPRNKVLIERAPAKSKDVLEVPEAEGPHDSKELSAAIPRPSLRGAMREDDSRAAASKRAAEILGHIDAYSNDGVDTFRAPTPPSGWTYEWKRHTIYNQEDPSYQVQLAQTGWEPVPLSRHPEEMPSNSKSSVIERKGQVLMMRPKEITDHFRALDERRATNQVKAKEAQLAGTPEGTMTRNDPRVQPKISKGYSPIAIPSE